MLATLGDAWRLYRLLFLRSVTTAAVVYAAIAILQIVQYAEPGRRGGAAGLLASLLSIGGPVLVQGALIEIVRNVHAGVPPERLGRLFRIGGGRFWPLFGATIIYGVGVVFGLLLLVVPGLLALARWSLIAPAVVLEGHDALGARRRSRELVVGRTGAVLACLVLSTIWVGVLAVAINRLLGLDFGTATLLTFFLEILTAPFEAHVLTVIYYRLAEPGRPVIDPRVLEWRSVWDGR